MFLPFLLQDIASTMYRKCLKMLFWGEVAMLAVNHATVGTVNFMADNFDENFIPV